MRIFCLAEYDPAGVLLSHRDALRARGHDFRVALHSAYTERQLQAGYVFERVAGSNPLGGGRRGCPNIGSPSFNFLPGKPDLGEMLDFALGADVLVACPGIGQPWADMADSFGPATGLDPPAARYFGLDWAPVFSRDVPKVAYFHGSVSAWTNRARYAKWYQNHGYALAASTVDYAAELPAACLPPILKIPGPVASLRQDDEPLVVAHCPTNPRIASTKEFLEMARELGIVVRYAHSAPYEESLAAKRGSHLTFDHLRGCYSVNSLEAAALRSAPLFALRYENTDAAENFPGPYLDDLDDLRQVLAALRDEPQTTRRCQLLARAWFDTWFREDVIAGQLHHFYEGLR